VEKTFAPIGKEKKSFFTFIPKFRNSKKKIRIRIMYPDGNIVILENNPPLLEDSVVRQIMSTQNRQYTPIDFRYITERKKRVDNLNYRAPNHYCRTVFEIAVSLTPEERSIFALTGITELRKIIELAERP